MSESKTVWPDPAAHEWDPKTATIRNEERVLIRVVVAPSNGVSVGGRHAPHGESFQIVYRKEVPAIERMLPSAEQRAWMATAKAQYDAEWEDHLKKSGFHSATSNEAKAEARRSAEETRAFSVESFYYKLFDKGPTRDGYPPITELEIGPGVAAPETPQNRETRIAEATAAAIGKALATHLQPGTTQPAPAQNQRR